MSKELPSVPNPKRLATIRDLKQQLLSEARTLKKGILEQLEMNQDSFNSDQLLNLIIQDMLQTCDDLEGASLFLEKEGDLAASSAITVKRTDLLKTIADIISRKKELSQKVGEVDLNSPAFCVFQKLCFDKMVSSMKENKLDHEMINLILASWRSKMENWGKELKKALKEMEDS